MPQSNYFSHGTKNEQYFHEDLIVESLHIYGQNFFYIPRTLISKDEILGEDRLSKFKSAYQIEMYLENVDGFDGQGAFIQKFGLMMEQSATLVVARRKWQQLVGRFGETIIPQRPCEGDLIYFPLTDSLFEIKFVNHQDPFYQIGKLYVYKLEVELFQYSSERLETGISEIDEFETLKSFDVNVLDNGIVSSIEIINAGLSYTSAPTVVIGRSWVANTAVAVGDIICSPTRRYEVIQAGVTGASVPTIASGIVTNGTAQLKYVGQRATATSQLGPNPSNSGVSDAVTRITVTGGGSGYAYPPEITFIGNGSNTVAVAYISNYDTPQSYGDNNKFKDEANEILFNESNPFGDVSPIIVSLRTSDSESFFADSTIITADIG